MQLLHQGIQRTGENFGTIPSIQTEKEKRSCCRHFVVSFPFSSVVPKIVFLHNKPAAGRLTFQVAPALIQMLMYSSIKNFIRHVCCLHENRCYHGIRSKELSSVSILSFNHPNNNSLTVVRLQSTRCGLLRFISSRQLSSTSVIACNHRQYHHDTSPVQRIL
jgi:hypothetical protein